MTSRVALIGGSSRGLGKACALRLAAGGAKVVICGRDDQSLQDTANEIRETTGADVLSVRADLARLEDVCMLVRHALDCFGQIDILVVNSGGPRPGSFFDMTKEDWDSAYQSVLYYVIELYRLVIPQMKARQWGRIINITSLTVKEPAETLVLSNVFRSSVVSLAKTLSRELIQHQITINTVCPGSFKTDRAVNLMRSRALKTGETLDEIERKSIATLPLGRFHTPDELGHLVAFLSSELSQGITGTTIQIDGGAYRGLF